MYEMLPFGREREGERENIIPCGMHFYGRQDNCYSYSLHVSGAFYIWKTRNDEAWGVSVFN